MNELTIYDPDKFETLQRIAKAMTASGYFSDAKEVAQAIVKIQAGRELGIPPFASMTGIHIIQGKPVLGANVIATLVKNDPRYNYNVKQCDEKQAVLFWYEDGKAVGESSFTWQEALGAGLTGKDNWKKYPSDMLFARAISRGARRFAPGIFGGSPVYTPDEMNVDVDEEGYVDTTAVEVVEPAPTPEPEREQPEAQPEPNGKSTTAMSLKMAESVTNSEGVAYGTLDTEKLTHMYNTMGKLKDKTEEHQLKMDAIRVILASRAKS